MWMQPQNLLFTAYSLESNLANGKKNANVNTTPGNMKIEESERTLLASVLHYIGVFCNEWRSFSLSKFRVNCLNN